MLGIWKKLIDVFGIQYFLEVFSLIRFLNMSYQLGMNFQQLPTQCAAIKATKAPKEFRQHQARCQAAAEACVTLNGQDLVKLR